MESVRLKKGFTYYWYLIVVSALLFLAGSLFITIFVHEILNDNFENKLLIAPFIGCWTIAFSIHNIYIHTKKVKTVTIDEVSITFGKKIYALTDIKHIDYTGKRNFGEIYPEQNTLYILFFNNDKIIVYDRYYINSSSIKHYLENILKQNEGKNVLIPSKKTFPVFTKTILKEYRGGFWGITSMIIALFLIAAVFFFLNRKGLIFAALISLAVAATLSAAQCYYFVSDNSFLIVKSFVLPWYRKKIAFADIKEIILETRNRRPNGLSIITNDFKISRIYYAATLYDRHWRELKHDLQEAGINIRDELHFG